jgi:hypothetical protein
MANRSAKVLKKNSFGACELDKTSPAELSNDLVHTDPVSTASFIDDNRLYRLGKGRASKGKQDAAPPEPRAQSAILGFQVFNL